MDKSKGDNMTSGMSDMDRDMGTMGNADVVGGYSDTAMSGKDDGGKGDGGKGDGKGDGGKGGGKLDAMDATATDDMAGGYGDAMGGKDDGGKGDGGKGDGSKGDGGKGGGKLDAMDATATDDMGDNMSSAGIGSNYAGSELSPGMNQYGDLGTNTDVGNLDIQNAADTSGEVNG
jgi:hypothetical protein